MHSTILDQCEVGQMSQDRWGRAPAKKPTRFLSNAWHLIDVLNIRCRNNLREEADKHRHVQLVGGRARRTQEYPEELCEKIVEGIQRQIEADKWNIAKVKVMKCHEKLREPKHDEDMKKEEENAKEDESWVAWDDITGAELDVKDIR